MHDLTIAVCFIAMVLAPCFVAQYAGLAEEDESLYVEQENIN